MEGEGYDVFEKDNEIVSETMLLIDERYDRMVERANRSIEQQPQKVRRKQKLLLEKSAKEILEGKLSRSERVQEIWKLQNTNSITEIACSRKRTCTVIYSTQIGVKILWDSKHQMAHVMWRYRKRMENLRLHSSIPPDSYFLLVLLNNRDTDSMMTQVIAFFEESTNFSQFGEKEFADRMFEGVLAKEEGGLNDLIDTSNLGAECMGGRLARHYNKSRKKAFFMLQFENVEHDGAFIHICSGDKEYLELMNNCKVVLS